VRGWKNHKKKKKREKREKPGPAWEQRREIVRSFEKLQAFFRKADRYRAKEVPLRFRKGRFSKRKEFWHCLSDGVIMKDKGQREKSAVIHSRAGESRATREGEDKKKKSL